MSNLITSSLALGALAIACTPTEGGQDAGLLDAGRNRPMCAVDRHNTKEEALALNLGMPFLSEAAICPPTDRDFYTFTLPGASLVQVDVAYPSGATTPVELAYEILRGPDDTVVASAQDAISGDNKSVLSRRHYLDQGGQYWLRVRDVGDDEQDLLNKYGVTVTAANDPDPNEPNDTCALAQNLGAMGTGVITFAGDKDAFKFDVPAGVRVVDATITTTKASSVDIQASLYDTTGRYLTKSVDPRGEDGPTRVQVRYGLQSPGGQYCIIIEDDDGADSDPLTRYQVTFQLIAEPDTNEQARRNDFPDDAVDLGAGGTRQGFIASTADLDWYRIDIPARRIAEITLSCPGCMIQPSVSIVYGDTDSPCDATSACDYVLAPSGSCNGDNDCESKICRPVPGGAKKCAKPCGDRFECGSFQCQQVASVSACVGAAACVTGLCGTLQYTGVADASTGTLRTAQPLVKNTSWILVRDFQDDQFSPSPYTLTVNIAQDPDTNEPNNFYFPYTDADPGDILGRGRDRATVVQWSPPSMAGDRSVSGRGCIAYQGDIDIFKLEGGNPCMTGNCGLALTYSRPNANPDLDLAWFLTNGGLGTVSSFLSSGEMPDTTFGDAICGRESPPECMIYRADSNGDYYLIVRDFNQDAWDVNAAQCYTWTLRSAPSSGCPQSCPTVAGNGICSCP